MKITDFDTWENAKLYKESTPHILNSNELTIALLRTELYLYFKEGKTGIHAALMDRVRTLSRFNFTTDIEGQGNLYMLQLLIEGESGNPSIKSRLEGFRDICITMSIRDTYPFAESTQAQFDEAKSLLTITGDTSQTQVGYPVVGNLQEWHIKLPNENIRVSAKLAQTKPVDTEIDIFAHVNDFENIFTKVNKRYGVIVIPAGELTGSLSIKKDLSRRVQFSGISNLIGSFELSINKE